jgi:hypothetical protein
MSSQIFYKKTPIRRNQALSMIAQRLKVVANTVKSKGEETFIKSTKSSTVTNYTYEGVLVTFDSYYDEKTTTVANAGTLFLSMSRNESYFDINLQELSKIEYKLGIESYRKQAA